MLVIICLLDLKKRGQAGRNLRSHQQLTFVHFSLGINKYPASNLILCSNILPLTLVRSVVWSVVKLDVLSCAITMIRYSVKVTYRFELTDYTCAIIISKVYDKNNFQWIFFFITFFKIIFWMVNALIQSVTKLAWYMSYLCVFAHAGALGLTLVLNVK